MVETHGTPGSGAKMALTEKWNGSNWTEVGRFKHNKKMDLAGAGDN